MSAVWQEWVDEDYDDDYWPIDNEEEFSQFSTCQCEYCPCEQETRYMVCFDCSHGVHKG